jgi:hypothetical protein
MFSKDGSIGLDLHALDDVISGIYFLCVWNRSPLIQNIFLQLQTVLRDEKPILRNDETSSHVQRCSQQKAGHVGYRLLEEYRGHARTKKE